MSWVDQRTNENTAAAVTISEATVGASTLVEKFHRLCRIITRSARSQGQSRQARLADSLLGAQKVRVSQECSAGLRVWLTGRFEVLEQHFAVLGKIGQEWQGRAAHGAGGVANRALNQLEGR